MLKIVIFIFALSLTAASVFAQNNSANAAKAAAFIELLEKKDFQPAHDFFDDNLKSKMTAEMLAQTWAQIILQAGNLKSKGLSQTSKSKDFEIIVTPVEFERASLDIQTAFDKQGKIAGFFIQPAEKNTASVPKYELPKYGNLESFTETEVKIGTGEFALPATLTMPKGKMNVPAVVLVHGSGPGDRDETAFGYKPFKDLAIGLASEGIAVLRYDKRTKVYPQTLGKNFTVNEETVNDAVIAAYLLMKTQGIDPKKVFVLGHSLGGYMIPRIAERNKNIAGFIVMAGSARPLEDIILEQNFDLVSKDGKVLQEYEKDFEGVKTTVNSVRNLKPADANSDKKIFNLPVSYWLDLQNYQPAALAAGQKKPMLILQGERDFQVKMTDFNLWKNALDKKQNAEFKSYPNLTHFFNEVGSSGRAGLSDYEANGNVAEYVVRDIAKWISKISKQ